jgi:hypothetical protein
VIIDGKNRDVRVQQINTTLYPTRQELPSSAFAQFARIRSCMIGGAQERGLVLLSYVYLELYIRCKPLCFHPLVYNSTPHPQWSSGYDFRLSLTPTSRGRPGFDSLLRSIQHRDSSSIVKCLPALANQRRLLFPFSHPTIAYISMVPLLFLVESYQTCLPRGTKILLISISKSKTQYSSADS